jgi:hypothetical protein
MSSGVPVVMLSGRWTECDGSGQFFVLAQQRLQLAGERLLFVVFANKVGKERRG